MSARPLTHTPTAFGRPHHTAALVLSALATLAPAGAVWAQIGRAHV